jgi:uncharacterized membrane protein YbjE (DUF340 family)
MMTIILFMILGILTGRLTRRFSLPHSAALLTVLIWVLLFVLGIEAGSNEQVVRSLPTLGVEALTVAVGGTLGSLILACWLWRRIRRTSAISGKADLPSDIQEGGAR